MELSITGARKNNLRNISVAMPLGKIIGVTGVSGSGKSTLARDIIAEYGYRIHGVSASKTIADSLSYSGISMVDQIRNIPPVIFINVVNSINNPRSTVGTITGINDILRQMFFQFGERCCLECARPINEDIFSEFIKRKTQYICLVDILVDKDYEEIINSISDKSLIVSKNYFNYSNKSVNSLQKAALATIGFSGGRTSDDKLVKWLRSKYKLETRIQFRNAGHEVNLLADTQIYCFECENVIEKLTLQKFSFNILQEEGGGACPDCSGSGKSLSIEFQNLIENRDKDIFSGGVKFVSVKGIKYTTVTEVFLKAFLSSQGIPADKPIKEYSDIQVQKLFYGDTSIIKFRDRVGGHKKERFRGICNYLKQIYINRKNKKALEGFVKEGPCASCQGLRLDRRLKAITLMGLSMNDFLSMSLDHLAENVNSCSLSCKAPRLRAYFTHLKALLENYSHLSCGYLGLSRECTTLSGGELQRIRMGLFLSSHINYMCYILDEPSSGLHPWDIQNVVSVIQDLKAKNNTVIVVEHNIEILKACDYIIDLGPLGGEKGGTVLFSDYLTNIGQYDTFTARYFLMDQTKAINLNSCDSGDWLFFQNLDINNLKRCDVSIPRDKITCICGISGSGKTTFLNEILYKRTQENPGNYGFRDVVHLAQRNSIRSKASTVSTLLGVAHSIATVFHKAYPQLPSNYFLLNSFSGKCPICRGKGIETDNYGEVIGFCSHCQGKRFSENTLACRINGLNIYNVLNLTIDELCGHLRDKSITNVLELCQRVSIGYLSLNRSSSSLSKGELQRIKLVKALHDKQKGTLFVLDEPDKGLHNADFSRIFNIFIELRDYGNTIVAVEHNMSFVAKSDYIVEFGPGSGDKGGEVIFSGSPSEFKKSGTSTARSVFGSHTVSVKKRGKVIKDSKKMSWSFEDRPIELVLHAVNHIDLDKTDCAKLLSYVNKLYHQTAIPNFINAHNQFTNSMSINIGNSAYIYGIDFANCRYRRSSRLCTLLGIDRILAQEFSYIFDSGKEYNAEYLASVFTATYRTGKCKYCGGSGWINTTNTALLFTGDELSKNTLSFLRKSSKFSVIKKELKKRHKIILSNKLAEMSDYEKTVLFYGDSDLYLGDECGKWAGLIPLVLRNLKYYPCKSVADELRKDKHIEQCFCCQGKLLDNKFREVRLLNLTFSDWLQQEVKFLLNKLRRSHLKKENLNNIEAILSLLVDFGLEEIHLFDDISTFEDKIQGMIKMISLYSLSICQSILLIQNDNILSKKEKRCVVELAEHLQSNNTLLFISD